MRTRPVGTGGTTVTNPDPMQPVGPSHRFDAMNRLLCEARTHSGVLCMSPAVTGMRVCRMHGGSSPQARNRAKLRLAELVDPAVATLAREMTQAEKSNDRQAAANSILDRAGFARVAKIEQSDARELLVQRLLAMQAEVAVEEAFANPEDPDD